jgi:hypothetical protein
MSRTRIALATASVVLGITGALIVLNATEVGRDRPPVPAAGPAVPAAVPAVPPALPAVPPALPAAVAGGREISVVRAGSRCLVKRGTAVVVFQILLRNPAREDQATRVHPSLTVRNSPAVSATSYDKKASLLATEKRTYKITVPYKRGTHPERCHVSLGNGAEVSIAVRQRS